VPNLAGLEAKQLFEAGRRAQNCGVKVAYIRGEKLMKAT
jgi:hypothetical protein